MTGIRELAISEAQAFWRPETTYLNTASYGLPPEPAWEALQAALADWRGGRVSWGGRNMGTQPGAEAVARAVRADGRRRRGRRRGRRQRVRARRAGRGGAAGRHARGRGRERVHVAAVPVPRPRAGRVLRAARAARGGDRRVDRRRGGQRGAVVFRGA